MSKGNHNIQSEILGKGVNPIHTAEVVSNKDDPEQAGRVRVRIVGHQADLVRIPDEKLNFARPMLSTSSGGLKGTGSSARMLPGTIVKVQIEEDGSYVIVGVLPRGDTDEETTDTHPAVHGHQATDKSPDPEDTTWGWNIEGGPSAILSTIQAREVGKKGRRRKTNIVDAAQNVAKNLHGRNSSKFNTDQFLSIASGLKFDGSQNAQEFIKGKIGNKGAALESLLPMIEQLKKTNTSTTPHAISAVGAGNFLSMLKDLAKRFPKKKKKDNEKTAEDLRQEEIEREAERIQNEELIESNLNGE